MLCASLLIINHHFACHLHRNSVVGNLLGFKERAKSFVAVPKLTAAESGSSSISVDSGEFSGELRAQGYHRNSISCLLM